MNPQIGTRELFHELQIRVGEMALLGGFSATLKGKTIGNSSVKHSSLRRSVKLIFYTMLAEVVHSRQVAILKTA
jgi:hypothetical protein